MNTQTNNELIADFLNLQHTTDERAYFISLGTSQYFNPDKGIVENAQYKTNLLFDTDWNWLMFTLDKIENLGFEISMSNESVFIRTGGGNTHQGIFYRKENMTKLEATYKTCVEFIKWYNR